MLRKLISELSLKTIKFSDLPYRTLQTYHNNPKYWDRQAWANSVDPDQMLQNAASDQGLHCLPLNLLDASKDSKINGLVQILKQVW